MDGFVLGLLVGMAVGLALGPVLRWTLAVREWHQASREADLADEVLRRMGEADWQRARPAPS